MNECSRQFALGCCNPCNCRNDEFESDRGIAQNVLFVEEGLRGPIWRSPCGSPVRSCVLSRGPARSPAILRGLLRSCVLSCGPVLSCALFCGPVRTPAILRALLPNCVVSCALLRLCAPLKLSCALLGFPGFLCALLCSPGLSWSLLGSPGFPGALLGSPVLSWLLLGSLGVHCALLCFPLLFYALTLCSLSGLSWALLCSPEWAPVVPFALLSLLACSWFEGLLSCAPNALSCS